MENKETFLSADGRYEIIHDNDCQGYVQVVEYRGHSPRLEVKSMSFPFELLAGLMDTLGFNAPSVEDKKTQIINLFNYNIEDNIVYHMD